MTDLKADETRAIVREHYANVSTGDASCAPGCCAVDAGRPVPDARLHGRRARRGARRRRPRASAAATRTAIASLRAGETVLDLGAGGGFDCFLAARAVGPTGRVIGVDMTPEMITRARDNARKVDATNVEFRLGEIEHLPVADGTVDVILSNCVINLSPDKARGVPRGVPRAARRRPARDQRRRRDRADPARAADAGRRARRLHRGAAPHRRRARDARRGRLHVDRGQDRAAQRRDRRARGWPGAERFIASATIEARRGPRSADARAARRSCCP